LSLARHDPHKRLWIGVTVGQFQTVTDLTLSDLGLVKIHECREVSVAAIMGSESEGRQSLPCTWAEYAIDMRSRQILL